MLNVLFSFYSFDWNQKIYDFGTIDRGENVETTFILTNNSNIPITLENVRTTCGCTAPYWSSGIILPRDTTHIIVQFNSKKIGNFNKKIWVYHSGQRKAEKLWIKGKIVRKNS